MQERIEEFKKARLNLLRAIDNFPKDKREEILFGKWNLKDTVAHISGWDLITIKTLRSVKKSKSLNWVGSVYEFNKNSLEKRKKWSWQKVYKEFVKLGGEITKEYEGVPEKLWNKRIWKNRSFTPQKFLEIDIRHYRDEHMPQIVKATKREKARA